MKVKLLLSYDGTDFGGWQKQKTDQPTVQGTLEQALEKLFRRPIKTLGAGRTDAGVHARGQICHFEIDEDPTRYNLTRSLNTFTPDSLSIRKAWIAPDDFHALASATKKTYKYLIHNSPTPNALRSRYSHWIRHELNMDLFNAYSEVLVGEHDFKSFQTVGTPVKSTVREIYECGWILKEPELLEFTISGNGFLKQMVRNIVGTFIDLHSEKAPPERLLKILAQKDRQEALGTAPAEGLYLHEVIYPSEIDALLKPI